MTNEQGSSLVSKRKSRYVRSPVELKPIRLTTRDLRILEAAGEYRILSTSQVQRLFFRSLHRTRKRLCKLWQHRLLDRRFSPIEIGGGSPETLYVLTPKGIQLLNSRGLMHSESRSYVSRGGSGSSLFLAHAVAVSGFRVALTKACREREDIKLISWRQGRAARQRVILPRLSAGAMVPVTIVPDSEVTVRRGKAKYICYLELDRGTETLVRLKDKVIAYLGLFRRLSVTEKSDGTEFRLLFVTVSPERARNILFLVRTCVPAADHRMRVLVATESQYATGSRHTVLDAIWQDAMGPMDELTVFLPRDGSYCRNDRTSRG